MPKFNPNKFPSLSYLFEAFSVNYELGLLYWNEERPVHHFATEAYWGRWRRQWAGGIVGILNPSDGYLYANLKGIGLRPVHRIIYAMFHELEPFDQPDEIDHENNDRTANWISNLRDATASQNKHNALLSSANSSGYKGVSFHTKVDKWRATICLNYKHTHLGYFNTPEEAYECIVSRRKEFHKEFSNDGDL